MKFACESNENLLNPRKMFDEIRDVDDENAVNYDDANL